MAASTVPTGPGSAPGAATPYRADTSGTSPRYVVEDLTWDLAGPGGVRSTVLDLLKWAGNFSSGTVGGGTFLRAQIAPGNLDGTGIYAAGIDLWQVSGRQLIVEAGGWPQSGNRAALVIDTKDAIAVALACNVGAAVPSSLAFGVLDAWLRGGAGRT